MRFFNPISCLLAGVHSQCNIPPGFSSSGFKKQTSKCLVLECEPPNGGSAKWITLFCQLKTGDTVTGLYTDRNFEGFLLVSRTFPGFPALGVQNCFL